MVEKFNFTQNSFDKNSEIESDFKLIFSILKEFLIYILMLIPNILMLFFSLILGKMDDFSNYLGKIFFEPFKIFLKISNWFFQAKYTAYLILFLIIIFLVQIFFINFDQILLNNLMTHPLHLFEGNYYSLFTSIFLHANFIHLLGNLVGLLIFGRIVEKTFGIKLLLLFISSGVIANLVSNFIWFYLGDLSYSLGASGAIAGIIIFAILLEPFIFTTIFLIPLPIFLVGWGLIFLDLMGVTKPSNVNHFAHLAGYGTLLILFFFLEIKHRKKILTGFTMNLSFILFIYLIIRIFGINLF